ncbi:glycosyl hydrolase [Candidatus Saccharibacteria bacterium RIFCSPHIGHO2_01_FULL_45_15]|nr:MAG: glycosyl hydrolase [Candidatus Saccharibacteria bacterium RIFCSPHIGHO2_01_FULL_45_15]OGL27155.1 MAG: glycosyl hydrolase [Candidatus Saccharibacteria bacterium RIFCSPHIGHO2_02_FULL_46_12]OGL32806.1 MAG: glycosyl hydrolase [Candidatus Saccharibacteria bacterium RIFCSPHIGHO2_12_FULL_44_22]
MKTITVLIPAYNEAPVLPKLFDRLETLGKTIKKYNLEFLFVNDGSRDDTLAIIKQYAQKDERVSYINLTRNFGKEIAMIAGIDHVDSDALVIIDADLQDPPELIPDMIKLWEEGYDDVFARRSSRLGESWFKKFTSQSFYKVLQRSTTIPIQRDTGDFRLLDRRCIDALKRIRESERYTKGFFSWIGFNKKEINYIRDPRAAGETKWNYFKLFNLAIDGIVSFTTAPLRISTILGIAISFFAFFYILIVIARTLFYGVDLAGYPSMMAVILFLGGVQLLSLGIIGEYIGRIFNETKQRPLYLIEEYHATSPVIPEFQDKTTR